MAARAPSPGYLTVPPSAPVRALRDRGIEADGLVQQRIELATVLRR